ncbi:MAG: molybdopterin-dependent oxidoreductase [Chloroflexi bacterium]|nr:molybdopterin-dependent oxidoreductase [Chloroflexota bacterium]
MSEAVGIKRTVCMWCHNHCKVELHIEGDRLIEMQENRQHRAAALYARTVRACPRARAAAEWFHHPDRLNYPLKRAGQRGEGQWETISWEQALDEIAQRLDGVRKQYGPEAIATTSGTYRSHDEYRTRFFNLLGSPNHMGQGHICWGISNMVAAAVLGWPGNAPGLRPGTTKCILIMGANPPEAHQFLWQRMLECLNAGAKLIVIDPRRITAAQRADIWLQPRPGTDCSVLMSMIQVIIEEGLYDREFVARWCHGFEELSRCARGYSPEEVARTSWVPADKIREAARLYATSRPAATFHHMGLEHLTNHVEALHARFILPAITGNVDVKGGDLIRPTYPHIIPEYEIELNEMLPEEQKKKALGGERFPFISWPGYELVRENLNRVWGHGFARSHHCYAHAPTVFRAMITGQPYPVRALITAASNPLVTMPNAKLVYQALQTLDLYVVSDFWLTPSADLADYALPAASWLERPTIFDGQDTISSIEVGETAFPPFREGRYDRRTDFELWRGLGIRLGQKEHWTWETLEEAYNYRLAPMGYTLKEFLDKKGGLDSLPSEYAKYQKIGFATPTGKVELYSTILEKLGRDPLPRYEEPAESHVSTPSLAGDYPLVLTTGGRFLPMYHSEHRQVASLRRQHPDPIAQINPVTASELGIKDGDWMWLETPRGRMKQKCQYYAGIDPRVVHAEHGWWFPEMPAGGPGLHGVWVSNVNVLTDDAPEHCNKSSGGWPLRALLCKVYKC